jgi:hypothetical protein
MENPGRSEAVSVAAAALLTAGMVGAGAHALGVESVVPGSAPQEAPLQFDPYDVSRTGSDDIDWGEDGPTETEKPIFQGIRLKEISFYENDGAFLMQLSDLAALETAALDLKKMVLEGGMGEVKKLISGLWNKAEHGLAGEDSVKAKDNLMKMLRIAINYLVYNLNFSRMEGLSPVRFLSVDFGDLLRDVAEGGGAADKARDFIERLCADRKYTPHLPDGMGLAEAAAELNNGGVVELDIWMEMLDRFGERARASVAERREWEVERLAREQASTCADCGICDSL